MTNRITGLATGLDVDSIIKQTMQGYRTKIDTQKQNKEVLEIRQKLYRDVITDAQKLYNTHFDILKSGSLINSKTWQSVKFTSNSDNLTVTGSSSAKPGNYTVSGNIGKAATLTLDKLETKTINEEGKEVIENKLIINGKEFKIEGTTNKEKADNLNKALSNAGFNISVRYTDFASKKEGVNQPGFIFESKVLGEDNNFVIGGKATSKSVNGTDAEAAKITGLTVTMLKDNAILNEEGIKNATFKIDDKEVTIDISKATENSDIETLLNNALSDKGYTANIDSDGKITLNSIKTGSGQPEPTITIKDTSGKYGPVLTTFENGKNATSAEMLLDSSELNIVINGVNIDLSKVDLTGLSDKKAINQKKADYINGILENQNIKITAKLNIDDNIILETEAKGKNSQIDFSLLTDGTVSAGGANTNIIIKDDKGGTYTHTDGTNSVTVDGITFDFTGEIQQDKEISVTSKVDATGIVEKVKSYIDDYNALIVKINTLVTEKRDRSYVPLTSEQKAEMSDKEIELWEAKVKQGQLKRDSDLMRINNSLKRSMSTLVSGAGLTLKDIGIESVSDYGGTKDGTFKVNEDTLKKAIEDDTEGVMNLFMQNSPSNVSEGESYSKNGLMIRLKDILYKETVKTDSSIMKKAGFEGTTTVSNNTLSKAMEKYAKKIEDMESAFSTKEQSLYNKYSKLEAIMNSYNSQMNYLSQSLGLSTS